MGLPPFRTSPNISHDPETPQHLHRQPARARTGGAHPRRRPRTARSRPRPGCPSPQALRGRPHRSGRLSPHAGAAGALASAPRARRQSSGTSRRAIRTAAGDSHTRPTCAGSRGRVQAWAARSKRWACSTRICSSRPRAACTAAPGRVRLPDPARARAQVRASRRPSAPARVGAFLRRGAGGQNAGDHRGGGGRPAGGAGRPKLRDAGRGAGQPGVAPFSRGTGSGRAPSERRHA